MSLYKEQRLKIAKTALSLKATRLVVNTSGNVSIRAGEHIIITPSGTPYENLQTEDICVLTLDGAWVDGERLPSSETPLHLAVYAANPSINAIVHTHSVHATAVSTITNTLPTIHYQMVDLGGEIPVAPYATYGSKELADSVISVLPGHTAVLMQNHGSITIGDTLEQALARTITLEWCCEVWLKAVSSGKTPSHLSDSQLKKAKDQMRRIAADRSKPREHRQDCRS